MFNFSDHNILMVVGHPSFAATDIRLMQIADSFTRPPRQSGIAPLKPGSVRQIAHHTPRSRS